MFNNVCGILKLTPELFERIIDATYEKSKQHPDLEIGDGTRHNCAEYIAFYAFHNSLYWCEQNGKIIGVSTVHPGRSEFSWVWPDKGDHDGNWTAHLVWADNILASKKMLRQFLSQHAATNLWGCKSKGLIELTAKKLKRLFTYGQRRHNHSSSSGSELSGVDAKHFAGTS
jgi:hypothetical protein